MKYIATTLLTAALATTSINANAWGEREQAALAGIAGVLVLQGLMKPDQNYQIPRTEYHYNPDPRYVQPYYNNDLQREYERGRIERERQIYEQMRRDAYNCGYSGYCRR